MVGERFTVLRVMSEIVHSTAMDEFIRLVGLTSEEVVEVLKELAQEGFVVKTKSGYAITEKGKLALTAFKLVPEDRAFWFYSGIDQPAGVSARSIKEFYERVKVIIFASLEFHLYRGDFESWVQAVVGDQVLASELENLRQSELRGKSLRERIAAAIEARYGIKALQ
jgi:predicted transcriptional regulator